MFTDPKIIIAESCKDNNNKIIFAPTLTFEIYVFFGQTPEGRFRPPKLFFNDK